MSDSLRTLWTTAHRAPLSMGFPRQEYCSGLPFHSPGDLPTPGIKLTSPSLAGRFYATEPAHCLCLHAVYWLDLENKIKKLRITKHENRTHSPLKSLTYIWKKQFFLANMKHIYPVLSQDLKNLPFPDQSFAYKQDSQGSEPGEENNHRSSPKTLATDSLNILVTHHKRPWKAQFFRMSVNQGEKIFTLMPWSLK